MRYNRFSAFMLIAAWICILFFFIKPVMAADDSQAKNDSPVKSDRNISDGWIRSKLITAFSLNEHLNGYDLDVQVKEGVVQLSGQVENGIERDLAGKIAEGVDGVAGIQNDIRMEGEKARKEASPFYQKVADATLTARVKSNLLWNEHTSGLEIDVDTENGTVTLRGPVRSEMEKSLALQVAENTRGVEDVRDSLEVNPDLAEPEKGFLEKTGDAVRDPIEKTGQVVSDTWITSKVKTVLMFNKQVEGADIGVHTQNGVVTLEGTVQSEAQKEKVIELADNVVNVKSVVSELRVR